jgi:hypothetical protein
MLTACVDSASKTVNAPVPGSRTAMSSEAEAIQPTSEAKIAE